MFEDSFELYKLLKLPIVVQDTIILKLTEQNEFIVTKENITKLNNELAIGRMNYFISDKIIAIKENIKKPAKKKVTKKKIVVDESSSEQDIFDLEL